MFEEHSEFCSALEARLKDVKMILKKGCAIGSVMIFDSRLGEINVIVHNDLQWYNDDDRQEVHIQLRGETFKGRDLSHALGKVKQTFRI